MAPSQQPIAAAEPQVHGIVQQFHNIAAAVRLMIGEPYFIELIDKVRAQALASIDEKLKIAGISHMAPVTRPVLDPAVMAELKMLRDRLASISRLQGEETQAAPAIAAAALNGREVGQAAPH